MIIEYGKEIQIALKHYRLSQRDISTRAGLNKQYINDVVHGKTSTPRLEHMIDIALVYKIYMKKHSESTGDIRSKIGNNILLDLIDLIDNRSNFSTDVI